MSYRLKQNAPAFTAVDGPMAGRRFEHGRSYDEIPAGDAARFEAVPAAAPAVDPEPMPTAKKSGRKSGQE